MDYLTLLQRPFYQVKANPATKSLGMSPLDDYWYEPVRNDDQPDAGEMFRSVAWLYRALQMRANAVASMPFAIMRGETEVDTSDDYQNAVGWLDNPRRLLYLTEASLTAWGAAYWWRERNRVATKGVRYIRPDTVEPIIDGAAGLTGFYRTANGRRVQVPVEQLAYFWQADPWVELGQPESSPLLAAMAASGVIRNLDRFSAAYFARGAIKATLLTVSGNPQASERERLKTWWGQMMTGVRNAFSNAVVNADSVTPVVIGEGLAELSNATLTAEKRQDIAQALGIPMTMLFSESARGLGGAGVASEDKLTFYDGVVVPECQTIAAAINTQIMEPMGLRFVFRPETLDVYQEDENARAAAFTAYVGAGLPVEVVGPMLGVELPEGWDWDKIAALKEERRQEMADAMQSSDNSDSSDDSDEDDMTKATLADLRRWRTKSAKRGRLATFESAYIPPAVIDDVKAHGSNGWRDALDGVIAVYAGEEPEPPQRTPSNAADTTELVAALRSATEALLHGQPQPAE